jgi:DNA-directed RNA polymerase specialized sigma24 family protein
LVARTRWRLADFARDPQALPFHLWLRLVTGQKLTDLHRFHLGAKMRDAGMEVSLHPGALPQATSVSFAAQLLGKITSASRAAIRAEYKLILQGALNGMEPIDREVLTLRRFEHLSNDESALLLGLSKKAASTRYIHALKSLKEILSSVPGMNENAKLGIAHHPKCGGRCPPYRLSFRQRTVFSQLEMVRLRFRRRELFTFGRPDKALGDALKRDVLIGDPGCFDPSAGQVDHESEPANEPKTSRDDEQSDGRGGTGIAHGAGRQVAQDTWKGRDEPADAGNPDQLEPMVPMPAAERTGHSHLFPEENVWRVIERFADAFGRWATASHADRRQGVGLDLLPGKGDPVHPERLLHALRTNWPRSRALQERFQGRREIERGRIPVRQSLRERSQADLFEFLRDRVVELTRRARLRGGDSFQDFDIGVGTKWSSPGQKLVEDNAQAEDVGTPIDGASLTPGLLGAHVGHRAGKAPAPTEVLVLERQPEVGDKGPVRGANQAITGLYVSMNQSTSMGVMQRLGNRGDQCRAFLERRSPLLKDRLQIASLDELGHHEDLVLFCTPHVVDRNDMRMVQTRKDAGLGQKGPIGLGSGYPIRVRNLDRNMPAKILVMGQENLAEPTLPELSENVVPADRRGMEQGVGDRRMPLER